MHSVHNSEDLTSRDGLEFVMRVRSRRSGYAKERLGDRLLAGAIARALNNQAPIDAHDLEIVKEKFLL